MSYSGPNDKKETQKTTAVSKAATMLKDKFESSSDAIHPMHTDDDIVLINIAFINDLQHIIQEYNIQEEQELLNAILKFLNENPNSSDEIHQFESQLKKSNVTEEFQSKMHEVIKTAQEAVTKIKQNAKPSVKEQVSAYIGGFVRGVARLVLGPPLFPVIGALTALYTFHNMVHHNSQKGIRHRIANLTLETFIAPIAFPLLATVGFMGGLCLSLNFAAVPYQARRGAKVSASMVSNRDRAIQDTCEKMEKSLNTLNDTLKEIQSVEKADKVVPPRPQTATTTNNKVQPAREASKHLPPRPQTVATKNNKVQPAREPSKHLPPRPQILTKGTTQTPNEKNFKVPPRNQNVQNHGKSAVITNSKNIANAAAEAVRAKQIKSEQEKQKSKPFKKT